ncbi:putative tensin [Operophtera brumata]|uniref:Putative tensin n=1 Tax=Operophtera brumata TaxID=104452 RepID=A0A0L7LT32_OPEBR|nr:putative tensin [Operophtera brumata]
MAFRVPLFIGLIPQSGARSASYPSGPASRLDLCYVAERMLALHLPDRDAHAEAQAAHMLTNKHGEHFMVFEVSCAEGTGEGHTARSVFGRARALGWAGELAPPLERLCAACKHIESWLAAHPKNVAILLAWGNRERLGVLVAAYMHYSAICGAPENALDRYAMRRYLDDRVPAFHLPSNKRYIDTFAGLLAGQIRVNAAPLQLTHVSVAGSLAAAAAPTIAFLKIYENFICVYTSEVQIRVNAAPLQLTHVSVADSLAAAAAPTIAFLKIYENFMCLYIRVNAAPVQLTHVSVAGSLAAAATPTIAFLKIYENFICVYTSEVQIRVNAAPLQLTHVSVAGSLAAAATPTIAFLKIYENFICVYTSGLYMVNGGGWTVGVGRLALRGDVLVRAYRRPAHAHASQRHLVFACQFHTCAVADHTLSFTKQQLDHAAHGSSC